MPVLLELQVRKINLSFYVVHHVVLYAFVRSCNVCENRPVNWFDKNQPAKYVSVQVAQAFFVLRSSV